MNIVLNKEENNVVKLDIEVPAKDAVDAYNRAAQRISQHINIPGFRKGKAPRNVIEQNVGEERIKYEALEGMLPRILNKAISENKLDVVAQPEVESYNFNVGEDLKIVAKVELRPEITLGEYKNLTIDVEEFKTPAEAFDNSINNLLQRAANYNVVVDRASKADDIVKFDFDGYVNGEKIQNGEGKNYTLNLAHSNFIPGFAEELVGHSTGEEFDINVKFPEDYHEEKLKGQNAVFKIKLHEIKEKEIPELNDEFAKKMGFDNVDALKADVQSFLDTKKQDQDNMSKEKAIIERLLSDMKVDIQKTMIDREVERLLADYKNKLTQQGFTWEQAVETQGLDEIMNMVTEDATKRIKISLLIDKLAKDEKINIEPKDLEKKLSEMEKLYQMDRVSLMKQLSQNPSVINTLSQQALNEKITKFLMENNTFNLVDKK